MTVNSNYFETSNLNGTVVSPFFFASMAVTFLVLTAKIRWLIKLIQLITVLLFPFSLYNCSRFYCSRIPSFTVFLIPVYNKDVYINATVQEKNITFPTDDKLERKIIKRCRKIADRNGLELHRSYRQILKNLSYDQRFRKRTGIELIIAHLKEDHRLSHNYYKGIIGDEGNVMLEAARFNFKRMINNCK